MYSKWKIKGIENYRFGEDKNLYRLPFVKGKRSYGFKLIKKQMHKRRYVNGKLISENQMTILKDDSPIEIFKDIDMPF